MNITEFISEVRLARDVDTVESKGEIFVVVQGVKYDIRQIVVQPAERPDGSTKDEVWILV